MEKRANGWPDYSPGSLNAWLLLVTTKPPSWQDAFVGWQEQPLTLGEPHEGFFYPDPLGFWAEVRRWTLILLRTVEPRWETADVLSVTALLHSGEDAKRVKRALDVQRPAVVVFLDEPAWQLSGLEPRRPVRYSVPDPHRPAQVYEGFWAHSDAGATIGKAPQHPAAHRLYRAEDMDAFLAAMPRPAPPP